MAGRCQRDAAAATIATPKRSNGTTGACPTISQPSPNPAIHKGRINPQYFLNPSAIIPPGRVINPETSSLTVDMDPTPIFDSPKVASTSGSKTMNDCRNQ